MCPAQVQAAVLTTGGAVFFAALADLEWNCKCGSGQLLVQLELETCPGAGLLYL